MLPPNYSNELFQVCDCGCEVLRVSIEDYSEEYVDVMLSIYSFDPVRSWKNRLRYIWRILTTGKPFGDQVIISSEKAEQLCNDILRNLKDVKDNG